MICHRQFRGPRGEFGSEAKRFIYDEYGRQEKRDIYGALIGAAGTLAAGGLSYASAREASKRGKVTQTPGLFPADTRALQAYTNRLMALNIDQQAPSFLDYMSSGGRARMPFSLGGGLTPVEARNLRFVDQQGQEIPYFNPATQTQLTPAQALFAGRADVRSGRGASKPGRLFSTYQRYKALTDITKSATADPRRKAQAESNLSRLRPRLEELIRRINEVGLAGVDDVDFEAPAYPRRRRAK